MRSLTTAKALCATGFMGESSSRSSVLPLLRRQRHHRSIGAPIRKPIGNIQRSKGLGACRLLNKKENQTTEEEGEIPTNDKPPRDFKIENLQGDVSTFLNKYRHFLDCCKTDLTELQQVEEMGDEVGDLLKSTQANMSNHSMASRGIMLREMIPTVSRARADLKKLRATLERISTSTNTRDSEEL